MSLLIHTHLQSEILQHDWKKLEIVKYNIAPFYQCH